MDKVRIAEWLLAQASNQQRAEEIVGDILEQTSCENQRTLSWRLLSVFLSMIWLRTSGIIMAAGSLFWISLLFQHIAGPHFQVTAAAHLYENVNVTWTGSLSSFSDKSAVTCLWLSTCAWTSALLIASLLPPSRSRLVPAFTISLGLSFVSWSASVLYATPFLIVVLTLSVFLFTLQHRLRNGLVVMLAGTAASIVMFQLTIWAVYFYRTRVLGGVITGLSTFAIAAIFVFGLIASPFAAAVCVRWTDGALRRRSPTVMS